MNYQCLYGNNILIIEDIMKNIFDANISIMIYELTYLEVLETFDRHTLDIGIINCPQPWIILSIYFLAIPQTLSHAMFDHPWRIDVTSCEVWVVTQFRLQKVIIWEIFNFEDFSYTNILFEKWFSTLFS